MVDFEELTKKGVRDCLSLVDSAFKDTPNARKAIACYLSWRARVEHDKLGENNEEYKKLHDAAQKSWHQINKALGTGDTSPLFEYESSVNNMEILVCDALFIAGIREGLMLSRIFNLGNIFAEGDGE
jgi:hypothetical protein